MGPLAPGRAVIGLRKVTPLWMISAFLRPLVGALERGLSAQAAVNDAMSHLSGPVQRVFGDNPVVFGDRNATF